jgi:hypothetical protein
MHIYINILDTLWYKYIKYSQNFIQSNMILHFMWFLNLYMYFNDDGDHHKDV